MKIKAGLCPKLITNKKGEKMGKKKNFSPTNYVRFEKTDNDGILGRYKLTYIHNKNDVIRFSGTASLEKPKKLNGQDLISNRHFYFKNGNGDNISFFRKEDFPQNKFCGRLPYVDESGTEKYTLLLVNIQERAIEFLTINDLKVEAWKHPKYRKFLNGEFDYILKEFRELALSNKNIGEIK